MMKSSKIKAIHIYTSDKKQKQNLAEEISRIYLRFVERKLNEFGLSKEEKIKVLDVIINNLKLQA